MGLRTLCWGGWQHPEKLIESNRPKMVYVPLKCRTTGSRIQHLPLHVQFCQKLQGRKNHPLWNMLHISHYALACDIHSSIILIHSLLPIPPATTYAETPCLNIYIALAIFLQILPKNPSLL